MRPGCTMKHRATYSRTMPFSSVRSPWPVSGWGTWRRDSGEADVIAEGDFGVRQYPEPHTGRASWRRSALGGAEQAHRVGDQPDSLPEQSPARTRYARCGYTDNRRSMRRQLRFQADVLAGPVLRGAVEQGHTSAGPAHLLEEGTPRVLRIAAGDAPGRKGRDEEGRDGDRHRRAMDHRDRLLFRDDPDPTGSRLGRGPARHPLRELEYHADHSLQQQECLGHRQGVRGAGVEIASLSRW